MSFFIISNPMTSPTNKPKLIPEAKLNVTSIDKTTPKLIPKHIPSVSKEYFCSYFSLVINSYY